MTYLPYKALPHASINTNLTNPHIKLIQLYETQTLKSEILHALFGCLVQKLQSHKHTISYIRSIQQRPFTGQLVHHLCSSGDSHRWTIQIHDKTFHGYGSYHRRRRHRHRHRPDQHPY